MLLLTSHIRQEKTLTHQQLMANVLKMVANQFQPEVSLIKKKIESLIEREYLERIEKSNPPSYRYLA